MDDGMRPRPLPPPAKSSFLRARRLPRARFARRDRRCRFPRVLSLRGRCFFPPSPPAFPRRVKLLPPRTVRRVRASSLLDDDDDDDDEVIVDGANEKDDDKYGVEDMEEGDEVDRSE